MTTSRFGPQETDAIIEFADGLVGHEDLRQFALFDPDHPGMWLQSVERAETSFVVMDPRKFLPGYAVPITPAQKQAIQLDDLDQAGVLVIMNITATEITVIANAPIVINPDTMQGIQIVFNSEKWKPKHPVASYRLEEPA